MNDESRDLVIEKVNSSVASTLERFPPFKKFILPKEKKGLLKKSGYRHNADLLQGNNQ